VYGAFKPPTRIIFAPTALSALICCPTPLEPSQTACWVHFMPQVVPVSPPLHWAAAATPLALMYGQIVSAREGTSWAVMASQRRV
jgi:hypothetical protein